MLIGIDGGGTKTALCLAREDGHLISQVRGLGTNPADVGIEECEKRLQEQLDELLWSFGGRNAEILSVYAGIAGSSAKEIRERLHRSLSAMLPNAKFVDNDTDGFNMLYSEARTGEGISLIAGTGSSCFALSGGLIHQIGGWGYLIDDAGSGYRMGVDALKAAYRALDGRGPATLLSKKCEEKLGLPLSAAISQIYAGGKRYIASFSAVVLDALREGDAVASEIADDAAQALKEHLLVAARFMHRFPAVTVVCGGAITTDIMMKRVLKALGPERTKFNIIQSELDPVYGTLVKAAINAHLKVDQQFRANFTKDYREG